MSVHGSWRLITLCALVPIIVSISSCQESSSDSHDGGITYEDCMSLTEDIATAMGCKDLYCFPGTKRCSGKTIQTCYGDSVEKSFWLDERTCDISCINSECSNTIIDTPEQPTQPIQENCSVGTKRCYGKQLQTCQANSGSTAWVTDTTCQAYCMPDKFICSETLPACKLTNNRKATIFQWTDGDTVWVRAVSDGTCNDYEFVESQNKYMNIRYDIRIHGIDAPECYKKQNQYNYYTCVKNEDYTNTNEPFGYEAYVAAEEMLPYGYEVILTCDKTESDGTCEFDKTESRYLTYIGFVKNNASYDFSIELTRQGLAFSNTKFASSKRKQICTAQQEAIAAKRNIWSLGNSVSEVLSQMGESKESGLRNMQSRCNDAMN